MASRFTYSRKRHCKIPFDILANILNGIKNAMNEEVEKVLMELQAPLKQYKSVIEVLEKAETELEAIFQTI